MESLELSFSTITIEYTPQNSDSGPGTPTSFTYDVTKPCLKN